MAYVPFAYDGEDPDDLLAEALRRIASRLSGWTPNAAHPEYAILSEMTRLTAETRLLASDVADAIFRSYGESLIALPPQPGIAATATAVFTFTDNTVRTIPAGTALLWPTGGDPILFTTGVAVSNTAGSTTTPGVQIAAAEPGTFANGLPAATLELVDALAYVASVASTTGSSGGQDPESDAEYLDRLSDSLRLFRRIPVLARDFAILARDITGVHRALAIDNYVPGTNEIQTVTVSSATGGTFTLTFEGQTTAAVAWNASASDVRAALDALSNIGDGDVLVTGGPLSTAAVTVEFTRLLADSNRTQMTSTSSLTGTGAAVAVATTREGVQPITNAERTITIAPVAEDGSDVPTSVRTELQSRLDSEREANFVVHTINPTRSALTITYTGQTEPGASAVDVKAAADQAVRDYLSPAIWGGGDERPPVWRKQPTVRYLTLSGVIKATPGMREVLDLTINGGRSDVTLIGPAPLPAPNPTITSTVTTP